MAHVIIETGRVGWGRVKGLWDGFSFLLFRITWGRGFLADRIQDEATKRRAGL